jgi:hypothetical protein
MGVACLLRFVCGYVSVGGTIPSKVISIAHSAMERKNTILSNAPFLVS